MTIWGLELTDVSASSLLFLVVIFILLGLLVPRSIYRDKINEANRWRSAYEAEREARAIAEAQSQELVERTRSIHDSLSVKHGAQSAPVKGDE